MEKILSVGIDIGTATTSMVVSNLYIKNTSSFFTVPNIGIVDKEVIYRSPIYFTPLVDDSIIDVDELKDIIADEYESAGITQDMVETGAVIITGESARKENADTVSQVLSEFAGDFVVATAGPDLESIIAGKGAGVQKYSKEHQCTIANIDIGGGTSNIAVFSNGELVTQTCFDIGGRLIKFDEDRVVSYVTPRARTLARTGGLGDIEEGMLADAYHVRKFTDFMADTLYRIISVIGDRNSAASADDLEEFKTPGSSDISYKHDIQCVSFSGGVADCFYQDLDDVWEFGDLGVALAQSIRESRLMDFEIVESVETIRATVIGAGTYTTTISGSTITCDEEKLPIKNVPALIVSREAEEACYAGDLDLLMDETDWFLGQTQMDNLIFALKGRKNISYDELKNLGRSLYEVGKTVLREDDPLMIVVEEDIAKALGRIIRRMSRSDMNIVCIDSVIVSEGDYLDLGSPMMNGMVIPVVVKTLVYGKDDRRTES